MFNFVFAFLKIRNGETDITPVEANNHDLCRYYSLWKPILERLQLHEGSINHEYTYQRYFLLRRINHNGRSQIYYRAPPRRRNRDMYLPRNPAFWRVCILYLSRIGGGRLCIWVLQIDAVRYEIGRLSSRVPNRVMRDPVPPSVHIALPCLWESLDLHQSDRDRVGGSRKNGRERVGGNDTLALAC